jgi:hypothetical protein
MNDLTTIAPAEIMSMGRMVAEDMPEFRALQKRLLVETPRVRRAVANALSGWASHPTTGMSPVELDAHHAEVKAQLARREQAGEA